MAQWPKQRKFTLVQVNNIFSYYDAPINAKAPVIPQANISLEKLYEEIKGEKYLWITEKLRTLTDKKAKKFKEVSFWNDGYHSSGINWVR